MGARRIGERIYPRSAGRRDAYRFVTQSLTGSYFTGTTADYNAHQLAVYGRNVWRNWVVAMALSAPADTIVEVGANVGTETVGFSDLVGAAGRVFAFEPMPDNVAALAGTIPLMTYPNVEVLPFAVGEARTVLSFASPPPSARSQGTGHILGPGERHGGRVTYHEQEVDWPVIEVPCVTLDSQAERLGAAQLVFIDAEGAEVGIVRGGADYIRAHEPGLVVEVAPDHLTRAGTSVEELHETLSELGYETFAFRTLGFELLDAPDSSIAPCDWLCLPRSRVQAVRSVARLLRRCALTPCIPRVNPLVGGRRPSS